MIDAVEENKGKVQLVHLVAKAETLKGRINNETRQQFAKITSLEVLEQVLEQYDVFSPYPEREAWEFDTSISSADAIADTILQRLNEVRL